MRNKKFSKMTLSASLVLLTKTDEPLGINKVK